MLAVVLFRLDVPKIFNTSLIFKKTPPPKKKTLLKIVPNFPYLLDTVYEITVEIVNNPSKEHEVNMLVLNVTLNGGTCWLNSLENLFQRRTSLTYLLIRSIELIHYPTCQESFELVGLFENMNMSDNI